MSEIISDTFLLVDTVINFDFLYKNNICVITVLYSIDVIFMRGIYVVLIPVSFCNNACTAAHLYSVVIVFKSSMYMKRRRSVHFYTLFYNIIQIG